jgi:hypothetical protein
MPKEREKWRKSRNHNFSRKHKQRGNPNRLGPELIAYSCGAALCNCSYWKFVKEHDWRHKTHTFRFRYSQAEYMVL